MDEGVSTLVLGSVVNGTVILTQMERFDLDEEPLGKSLLISLEPLLQIPKAIVTPRPGGFWAC